MSKKTLFVIVICVTAKIASSQQSDNSGFYIDQISSQDIFINKKMINPAFLLDSNKLVIDLFYAEQWIGGIWGIIEYNFTTESAILS